MLIAQISDTHILASASDHPSVRLRADCLRQCVADINNQQPDAVIFTGDTVQTGEPEEYEHLQELLAPLKAPLYLVPGNRDDNRALRTALNGNANLPRDGDFLHYAVENHAVRLVAIDSTGYRERKGVFCAVRQAWLDTVLSEQPNRSTLLFIHHPPFDIDDHYIGGYRRPEEAAALAKIVSRHVQVQGLLCGHVHSPVDHQWAGTRAIVMPSIAVDLRKGIDETMAKERPIYMLHRLSEETGLVSVARTVDA
jgi:3',5'-cyclic AMP phosphodiesterase CpdA